MQRAVPLTVMHSTKKNSSAICNLLADLQHTSPLAALSVQYAAPPRIAGSFDTHCGVGGGETWGFVGVQQTRCAFLRFGLAFLPWTQMLTTYLDLEHSLLTFLVHF